MGGNPSIGADSLPLEKVCSVPFLSEINKSPLGRKAKPQGTSNPVTTVSITKLYSSDLTIPSAVTAGLSSALSAGIPFLT